MSNTNLRRLKGVSSDKITPLDERRRSWGDLLQHNPTERLPRDQLSDYNTDAHSSHTLYRSSSNLRPTSSNSSELHIASDINRGASRDRVTTHSAAAAMSREKEREKDYMNIMNAQRGAKRLFRARSVGSVRESTLSNKALPPLFEFEAADSIHSIQKPRETSNTSINTPGIQDRSQDRLHTNLTGDLHTYDSFSASVHRPVAADTKYPTQLSPRSHNHTHSNNRRDKVSAGLNNNLRLNELIANTSRSIDSYDMQSKVDAMWVSYKRGQERRTSRVNSMQFMNALRHVSQHSQLKPLSQPQPQPFLPFQTQSQPQSGASSSTSAQSTPRQRLSDPSVSLESVNSCGDTVCFYCHQIMERPAVRSPRTEPLLHKPKSVLSNNAASGPNTPYQHSPRNSRTQLSQIQAGVALNTASPRARDIYQSRKGLKVNNFTGLPKSSSPHIRKSGSGRMSSRDFASVPELDLHGLTDKIEREQLRLGSISPGMSDSALNRATSAIDSAVSISSPMQVLGPNTSFASLKRSMSHKMAENTPVGPGKVTLTRSLTDTQRKAKVSPGGTQRSTSQFVNRMVENIEKGQSPAASPLLPENREAINRELLSASNAKFSGVQSLPTRYDWSPTSVKRVCNDFGMTAGSHSSSPRPGMTRHPRSPSMVEERGAEEKASSIDSDTATARSSAVEPMEPAGNSLTGSYLQQYLDDLEDREDVVNGTPLSSLNRRNSGGQTGAVHTPPPSHVFPNRLQAQSQIPLQALRVHSTPIKETGIESSGADLLATEGDGSVAENSPHSGCLEGSNGSACVADAFAHIDAAQPKKVGYDTVNRASSIGICVSSSPSLGLGPLTTATSPPMKDLLNRCRSWPGVQTIAESSESPLSPHDEEETESEHDHTITPTLVFGALEAPGPASSNWKPIPEKHTFLNINRASSSAGLKGSAIGRNKAGTATSVGLSGGRRRPASPGGLCDLILTESEDEFNMESETDASTSSAMYEHSFDMCLSTEGIMEEAESKSAGNASSSSKGPLHQKTTRLEMSSIDETNESILA